MDMLFKSAQKNKKKNGGQHTCCSCKGVPLKIQNDSSYWTSERRALHAASIRTSERYQEAISARDTSGPNNGMYGKKMSQETRQKMSLSRTDKTGPSATAWKGGKTSLTKRVKGVIHTRHRWYYNVYKRDGWACQACGRKSELDAHHIRPISVLIKELLLGRDELTDDNARLDWLAEQPQIVDENLENGITLCRPCHKRAHQNWGSHYAQVR